MGQVYDEIDDRWREWIAAQPLFFVGTAPLDGDGHVNVSPKGPIDTLQVLDSHTVAYLDLIGSGAETIAHVRENGRIVIMLCAFEGPPRVVRLHGRAEALAPEDPLAERFDLPEHPVRSVIRVDVERIADSCGYGVPLMRFEAKRTQYDAWMEKKLRDDALDAYVAEKNALSIDGLPAVGSDTVV